MEECGEIGAGEPAFDPDFEPAFDPTIPVFIEATTPGCACGWYMAGGGDLGVPEGVWVGELSTGGCCGASVNALLDMLMSERPLVDSTAAVGIAGEGSRLLRLDMSGAGALFNVATDGGTSFKVGLGLIGLAMDGTIVGAPVVLIALAGASFE